MIRMDPVKDSVSFYKNVTVPGRKYLAEHPSAAGKLLPNLWNKCRSEVYRKYHGICAYLCVYMMEASGYEVDHFVPKSKDPKKAFDWGNLRLSSSLMNKKKGVNHVVDPFLMPYAALRINFFTGRVSVDKSVTESERNDLLDTICQLRLNSHEVRKTRTDAYVRYKRKRIDADTLSIEYPFAAFEMMRQRRLRVGDATRCARVLSRIGFGSSVRWLKNTLDIPGSEDELSSEIQG